MRPWQFSKPKNPGFGISRSFYLSVLSSSSVMPSIREIINPAGDGGAATGMCAPLTGGSEKARLSEPLSRGPYAIATKDRKTVLKMLVLSKEEAGYDPEAFALSQMAADTDPELLARLRGTWTLSQFTFESHDPMVYPAMDFLLGVCARLADLSQGVVADPISQRYLLPNQVFHRDRIDPRIDARDHVSVASRDRPDGFHSFTLGLQKFALPEFEITGLLENETDLAERFLMLVCQNTLAGDLPDQGSRYGAQDLPFEARPGGFDAGMWEGIAVLELLPPTRSTAGEALNAWRTAIDGR
jgi:hypothetical protein